MSAEIGQSEPKEFNFDQILERYLTEDDRHDMDAALDRNTNLGVGALGAIVAPSGESVQRIREPLSQEAEQRFGELAFKALARTDLYLNPED